MTLLAGIILLGVLVFIHELGHFLVAKACGVRVLTFSIGFGPRIFGFRHGDTDYRVSILPLGGYVRMYGDSDGDPVPASQYRYSFFHQPYLKKSAIAAAGPIANFLLPVVMFLALFMGTERVPDNVVNTVFPEEPAFVGGLREGDRIVGIDGHPIQTFTDVQAIVEESAGKELHFSVKRDGELKNLTITPKHATTGVVLGMHRPVGRIGVMPAVRLPQIAVVTGSDADKRGLQTQDKIVAVDGKTIKTQTELQKAIDDNRGKTISLTVERKGISEPLRIPFAVPALEPAAPVAPVAPVEADTQANVQANVQANTQPVLQIDNKRFLVTDVDLELAYVTELHKNTEAAVRTSMAQAFQNGGIVAVDGLVGSVEENTAAASLGLQANDRIVAVDGAPLVYAASFESSLARDVDGVHAIGVFGNSGVRVMLFRLAPSPRPELGGLKVFGAAVGGAFGPGGDVEREVGFAEALRRSVHATWDVGVDTLAGLRMLVTGQVGLSSVGGPITIFNMAGQAAEAGSGAFLSLMVFMSVNLGIMNLLPVPVLDGGHLLIFTIEAILRRKIDEKYKTRALQIGMLLMGSLMIFAFANDIWRLFQ